MKSPTVLKGKIQKRNQGFTLIEIIIVTSIIVAIGSLGLYFGFSNFYGHSFNSNRDILISVLQHARAEAIANICRGNSCEDGKPHGVAIRPNDYPNSYVIFQTESVITPTYSGRTSEDTDQDVPIDANPNFDYSGLNEVVFRQLSGEAISPGSIVISDNTGTHTSTITINSEGQILWTN